jgi:hypothetical protein
VSQRQSDIGFIPHTARLVRRDLAATAALFARSIGRHLAQHGLKASRAAPVASKGDHEAESYVK